MKKIALLITILSAGALNGMESPKHSQITWRDLPIDAKAVIVQALQTYDNPNDTLNAIKAMGLSDKELNKIVNDVYLRGNLKDFTALVHILANKFKKTTFNIATKFVEEADLVIDHAVAKVSKSETWDELQADKKILEAANNHYPKSALQYLDLFSELMYRLSFYRGNKPDGTLRHFEIITQLLEQGADSNGSKSHTSRFTMHNPTRIITQYSRRNVLDHALKDGDSKLVKLLLDFGAKPKSEAYYDAHHMWTGMYGKRLDKIEIKQLLEEARKK